VTAGLFELAGTGLRLDVVGSETQDGVEIEEIRFDDGSGGAAAALVAIPPGGGRVHAGVVVAHGGYEGGKHIFVPDLVALANRGIVALAADTTLPRDPTADEWEAAMGAAVRLQRRGFDVLEERHGAGALGYFGHSAGGLHGAILSVVEPRLRAVVIAALGAGVITRAAREVLGEAEAPRIARLDPGEWVSRPGARTLFVQHGRDDDVIDRAWARELYDLAADPKRWAEYDCGHGVDGHVPARNDRLDFFEQELA
jgi:hypothetical protein